MNKIYGIYDAITDKSEAVMIAENDKDFVRKLVLCGFFKLYRLQDVYCYDTGLELVDGGGVINNMDLPKKVNIEEICKELSIQMENEAEKIDGTPTEVKEKIEKKSKGE